jgi:exodeoxyribonuclease VII large subunit
MEDLWPFNEEVVARAIYASKTPVVSAVGHETDETISDYVADVRAPTPSAAAELVVPDSAVLRRNLDMAATALYRVLMDSNSRHRSELTAIARRMELSMPATSDLRRRVDDIGRIVQSATSRLVRERQVQVDGLNLRLRALDPVATLGRGFSIVHLPGTGQVVAGVKQVTDGDALEITVSDGSLAATAGNAVPSSGTNGGSQTSQKAEPKPRTPKAKAKPVSDQFGEMPRLL